MKQSTKRSMTRRSTWTNSSACWKTACGRGWCTSCRRTRKPAVVDDVRAEKREKLLRLARTRDFYVVADEVYHLLSRARASGRAPPPRFQGGGAGDVCQRKRQRERDDGREIHVALTATACPYARAGGEPPPENASPRTRRDDDSRVVSLGSFKARSGTRRAPRRDRGEPACDSRAADRGSSPAGAACTRRRRRDVRSTHPTRGYVFCGTAPRGSVRVGGGGFVEAVSKETAATRWRMRNTPSGGYFAWIDAPEGATTARPVRGRNEKERVATGRGSFIQARIGTEAVAACGRCVRVCFAYLDEEDIEEGSGGSTGRKSVK